MSRSGPGALALLLVALGAGEARAQRTDHRGSVGLLLQPGALVEGATAAGAEGVRGAATLGGTLAIGHADTELLLLLTPAFFRPAPWLQAAGGVRMFYGYDRLKTFLDLTACVVLRPALSVGPRLAGGFQIELSPVVGVYAGAAVQFGFGVQTHLGGEAFLGIQLRSYLLEG